jgi:hypothetical protein
MHATRRVAGGLPEVRMGWLPGHVSIMTMLLQTIHRRLSGNPLALCRRVPEKAPMKKRLGWIVVACVALGAMAITVWLLTRPTAQ